MGVRIVVGLSRERAPSARVLLIALLCAGQFTSQFDRFLIAGALSYVKQDLGLSDTALGLIEGTIFALVYGLVSLLLGRLGGMARQRWLIVGGLALWTAGSAATGFADSFTQMAGARLLLATGEAAFAPAAVSLIAGAAADARLGRAVSLFTAASTLGRAGAVFISGLLIVGLAAIPLAADVAPWRLMFAVTALPNLLLLVLLAVVLAGQEARVHAGEAPPVTPPLAGMAEHRKRFAAYCLAGIAPILLIQSIAAWYPTLCARLHGIEPSHAAVLVGGVTLATSPLGQLLGGWLMDRVPRIRRDPVTAILIAVMLTMPPLAAVGYARSLTVTLIALALLNLILGVASLVALAGIQIAVSPALRVRANGIFFGVVTVAGLGIGPVLVGLLSDAGAEGPGALSHALLASALIASTIGASGVLLGRSRPASVPEGREEMS